jgi:hypothetical protein
MKCSFVTSSWLAIVATGCAAHTLAEAVIKRTDEFPRNSMVLIPPADIDRLGQTVEDLGERRARPTGERCFDVAPVAGKGLSKIELSYKAGTEFQAEVKEIAAQAGGTLNTDDKATMALDNLVVKEGFGVPIRKSCGFHDGAQTVKVITATVAAGTARLEFSRNISFNVSGKGGWSSGSGSGGVNGSVAASGQLQGTNIVIAGAVTPVEVTFVTKQQDLGATPAPGTVVSFPPGYDGNVRIDEHVTATADHIHLLKVTANTPMNASAQNVPANLKGCTVGQSTVLRPGDSCFVWNQNGASGVNIWFNEPDVSGSQHVVVHLDGYESHFKPGG